MTGGLTEERHTRQIFQVAWFRVTEEASQTKGIPRELRLVSVEVRAALTCEVAIEAPLHLVVTKKGQKFLQACILNVHDLVYLPVAYT